MNKDRPYIIIHTHMSLDGNINSINVPGFEAATRHYQEVALAPGKNELNIDAYLNGKTSTQDNVTGYSRPVLDENAPQVPEGDYWSEPQAECYYISIDARGELKWENTALEYGGVSAHFVEVLTEQASNAYKHYLREVGISYIICGEREINYELMLSKLYEKGIKRLMIGGGGTINWSSLQQRLVDEVSVMLTPAAKGDDDTPRLFSAREPYSSPEDMGFTLKEVRDMGESVVWLRYTPVYS